MSRRTALASRSTEQDERYQLAAAEFGPALDRLARGYEADADLRRDLRQEIHLQLWRSLATFDGRCTLRTWAYRVAHNVGASHVLKRRAKARLVGLDELQSAADVDDPETTAGERQVIERLHALIRSLKPPDSQVMLLYLEDLDAGAIGEVTGLSSGAVAVKIHRIKAVLAQRFRQGGRDER
jgi:RNA polymerase sigma-70 factor (ECF subfamily)